MRRTLLALALLAVFAVPGTARASHSCHEVSDIVGYEHCRRFGDTWAFERSAPFSLELGLGPTWLDPRGRLMNGGFGKHQPGSFHYPGDEVGHALFAVPLSLRLVVPFVSWAYAGAEIAFGLGGNRLPATEANGYIISAADGGAGNTFEFGGGLFAGLRAPLGYLSLRFETFLGGRTLGVTQVAKGPTDAGRPANVGLSTWVIEPRLYADVWVEPWMTLGIFGGINAIHFADHTVGLTIGFHARHYDGAFLW